MVASGEAEAAESEEETVGLAVDEPLDEEVPAVVL